MATKTTTWRCSVVTVVVISLAIVLGLMADDGSSHIVSIVSGMIVSSWVRGPRGVLGPVSTESPCARISRRTRSFDVRTPMCRSRAQTFPWNGLAASMSRIRIVEESFRGYRQGSATARQIWPAEIQPPP